jgi:hypothetical protein
LQHRACTFRHKYKILDALKRTWQIGIPAKGDAVKRCHKLLLATSALRRAGLAQDPPKKLTVLNYYTAHRDAGWGEIRGKIKAVCYEMLSITDARRLLPFIY